MLWGDDIIIFEIIRNAHTDLSLDRRQAAGDD